MRHILTINEAYEASTLCGAVPQGLGVYLEDLREGLFSAEDSFCPECKGRIVDEWSAIIEAWQQAHKRVVSHDDHSPRVLGDGFAGPKKADRSYLSRR